MKKKYRNNVFQRIIAMILAVVLAFTMLPPTVITHAETKKSIKISVTDAETGQILPVSIISNIEIKNANDETSGINYNGEDELWETSEISQDIEWRYSVAATGYVSQKDIPFILSDDNAIIDIKMVKLEVGKTEDETFRFDEINMNVSYGTQNVANQIGYDSDSKGGTVVYTSGNSDIAEVDSDGNIKINKVGKAVIYAKIEGSDSYQGMAAYMLNVSKGEQAPLYFGGDIQGILYYGKTEERYKINAVGGSGDGNVTYVSSNPGIVSINVNSDGTQDGTITIKGTGEVTITATKEGNEFYNPISSDYTINIEQKVEKALEFENNGNHNCKIGDIIQNKVKDVEHVKYKSSDGDIASVDEDTGDVTAKKKGNVTITAHKESDNPTDLYEYKDVSYNLQVEYKSDSGFKFDKAEVSYVYKKDELVNISVDKGKHNGEKVTYTSSNPNVACFVDESIGKITIKGVGETTITAKVNEDGVYEETKAECVLTVNKAEQNIKFIDSEKFSSCICGQELKIADVEIERDGTKLNSSIDGIDGLSYKITDANDRELTDEEVKIDNGKITFFYGGTYTVNVIKASDEYYNEASSSYNVNVKYKAVSGKEFEIKDEDGYDGEIIGDKIWFNKKVFISALKSNKILIKNGNSWKEVENGKIEVDNSNKIVFRIVDDDNCMSEVYTTNIEIDKSAPLIESIKIDDKDEITRQDDSSYIVEKIENKNKVSIDVTVNDNNGSGIKKLEYYTQSMSGDSNIKSEEEIQALSDWKELNAYNGKYSFDLDSNSDVVIYFKVSDEVGNVAYAITKEIIFDTEKPTVEIVMPEPDKGEFYSKSFDVKIEVNDKEDVFTSSSGIKSIEYTLDDENVKEEDVSWNPVIFEAQTEDGKVVGKIRINASEENNRDDINIRVKVSDNAGNIGEAKKVFSILYDKEIALEYEWKKGEEVISDWGNNHFNKKVMLVTTVRERRKAASEKFDISLLKGEYSKVKTSLVEEENDKDPKYIKRSITYIFDEDMEYKNIQFVYINKVGDEKCTDIKSFVVDTIKPQCKIEHYKTSDSITFKVKGLSEAIDWKKSAYAVNSDKKIDISEYVYFTDDEIQDKKDRKFILKEDSLKGKLNNQGKFYLFVHIVDLAGNSYDKWMTKAYGGLDVEAPEFADFDVDSSVEKYNGFVVSKKIKFVGKVKDPNSSNESLKTGIKSVQYRVKVKGDSGKNEWKNAKYINNEFSFEIDQSNSDGEKISVKVRAEDNSGNITEYSKEIELTIDNVAPRVNVRFYGEHVNLERNKKDKTVTKYFNSKRRRATITVTEKDFNRKEAETAIAQSVYIYKDGNYVIGNEKKDFIFSKWNDKGDVHSIDIYFEDNNSYKFLFSPNYMDLAGRVVKKISYPGEKKPVCFVLDNKKPSGSIEVKDKKKRWFNHLADVFSLNVVHNKELSVTIESEDNVSPFEVYYHTSKHALNKDELEALWGDGNVEGEWTPYSREFTIKKNRKLIVYGRIEDYAGNVRYISSDGIVVDGGSKANPQIEIQRVENINNGDVAVNVSVKDPEVAGVLSGINKIWYEIKNNGTVTQYTTQDEPWVMLDSTFNSNWNGVLTVDKINNSNDVTITVYAEDYAGNISSKTSEAIKIDTSAPEITVNYDNNSPDSIDCYKSARVATVIIRERNFDPNNVIVRINNTEGGIPTISGWTEIAGAKENGDDIAHVATITYHADGDYTFDIECTDKAGNKSNSVEWGDGTTNPTAFTIDQTIPVISVSYDNQSVQNGKYFSSARTATVHVIEHNFDPSRVIVNQTASLNGVNISVPQILWSDNGDNHIGTIVYNTDGDYTFDVTMTDKAGNQSGETVYAGSAGKEFTIDTTIEKASVIGVENGKSYKDSVIPEIKFNDINFSDYKITLLRTYKDHINEDVTSQFIKDVSANAQGIVSINDTIDKVQMNDGIYTLNVEVKDKAGNTDNESVTFTVNRFGSVYAYSNYTAALKNIYLKKLDDDIVITEYNPDQIVEGSLKMQVTRDGTPLENVEYEVTPQINDKVEIGDSGWYQYEYRLAASNFMQDGVYKINVATEDIAGNMPETANYEDGDISFMVDTTPAEITNIKGLENEFINTQNQNVQYDIFDSIGIKNIKVFVNDQEIQNIDTFDNLVNYSGTFDIGEGVDQRIRLVVEDLAGNIVDTDSKDFKHGYKFNNKVTVSTNVLIRWYANKFLFWGSIAIVVVLAGFMVIIIAKKSRKKEE